MKIVAAGDSFTYGEELNDIQNAYPYVLGSMLPGQNTVINLARPAASNDKIVRSLCEYLLANSADLVVIGWTSPGRIEFADEKGEFDIWPGYNGNLFAADGLNYRATLNKYFSTYHSRSFLYKKYLQNIILTQSLLKMHNIKYVMMDVVLREFYKMLYPYQEYQTYHSAIDQKFFIDYNKSSMVDWVGQSPLGPRGHFLEEGHTIVANRIYEHIRNISWVS